MQTIVVYEYLPKDAPNFSAAVPLTMRLLRSEEDPLRLHRLGDVIWLLDERLDEPIKKQFKVVHRLGPIYVGVGEHGLRPQNMYYMVGDVEDV